MATKSLHLPLNESISSKLKEKSPHRIVRRIKSALLFSSVARKSTNKKYLQASSTPGLSGTGTAGSLMSSCCSARRSANPAVGPSPDVCFQVTTRRGTCYFSAPSLFIEISPQTDAIIPSSAANNFFSFLFSLSLYPNHPQKRCRSQTLPPRPPPARPSRHPLPSPRCRRRRATRRSRAFTRRFLPTATPSSPPTPGTWSWRARPPPTGRSARRSSAASTSARRASGRTCSRVSSTCATCPIPWATSRCAPGWTTTSSWSACRARLACCSSSLRRAPRSLPTLPAWPSSRATRPFSRVSFKKPLPLLSLLLFSVC